MDNIIVCEDDLTGREIYEGRGRRITMDSEPDPDAPPQEKAKYEISRFAGITTGHGFSRIKNSRSNLSCWLWFLAWTFSLALFTFEAMSLLRKFYDRTPTTTVKLKFDQVDFPAITFCNLNPYKKSLVMMVPSIRDTMDVYDNAKTHSKDKDSTKPKFQRRLHSAKSEALVRELFADEIRKGEEELSKYRNPNGAPQSKAKSKKRARRSAPIENRRYEAIEAHCKCVGSLEMECIRFESPPKDQKSKCVCTYDRDMMVAWPCFNISIWYDHMCPFCSEEGYCEASLADGETTTEEWPCKCRNRTDTPQTLDDKPYCIGKAGREAVEIRKLWIAEENTTTTTTTTTTTPPPPPKPNQRAIVSNPETIKAMGFAGMTDGVAMLTKAKENLMFTMSALSKEQRKALSQSKHEFIEMCSFNGKQCDIDADFKLHVDPEFGNCFTFNYDVNNNYTSSRAGPMYGIRVLLFVNTSDYMSTSESAGVRLAIHSPTEYPFPDTFGYSAPVGFASSFGMKKKIVQRLPHPYGDCVQSLNVADKNYIYQPSDYHPEGCHRSCFQNRLINLCSCGDPRFPVPPGYKHCSAFNATDRACLESKIGMVGDFHHMTEGLPDCACKPSCTEVGHEVTFSASKWPSGATDLGDCDGMTEEECETYYRLNAAMVEVFYEQLNYELLQESEAYGLVNLIADFGGHLGLWLGFSVITVMEVAVLIVDLFKICFSKCRSGGTKKSSSSSSPRAIDDKHIKAFDDPDDEKKSALMHI